MKNKIYILSDKNIKVMYNKNKISTCLLTVNIKYVYTINVLADFVVHGCKEVYYGII